MLLEDLRRLRHLKGGGNNDGLKWLFCLRSSRLIGAKCASSYARGISTRSRFR